MFLAISVCFQAVSLLVFQCYIFCVCVPHRCILRLNMFSVGPATKIAGRGRKELKKRKNKHGRDEELGERLTGKQVTV